MSTDDLPDIAARLRKFKEVNRLSLGRMSLLTGVPKASLQNYMKSEDAQKPGFEALVSISKGLNISLDWLAGSWSEISNGPVDLAEDASFKIARKYFEAISASDKVSAAKSVVDGKIFGRSPEDLANIFADEVVQEIENNIDSVHRKIEGDAFIIPIFPDE